MGDRMQQPRWVQMPMNDQPLVVTLLTRAWSDSDPEGWIPAAAGRLDPASFWCGS